MSTSVHSLVHADVLPCVGEDAKRTLADAVDGLLLDGLACGAPVLERSTEGALRRAAQAARIVDSQRREVAASATTDVRFYSRDVDLIQGADRRCPRATE